MGVPLQGYSARAVQSSCRQNVRRLRHATLEELLPRAQRCAGRLLLQEQREESARRGGIGLQRSKQMKATEVSFEAAALRAVYRSGAWGVHEILAEVSRRIHDDERRPSNVWLHVRSNDELQELARQVESRRASGEALPLFGLPFAVKDNIDVAGIPTTAACPAFAYVPRRAGPAVERLTDAGAILVGKVNMDQFATGLVGVRSPYGIPSNPFDSSMIPGGSSPGSAIAVATGQVCFALGTDTGGSGRVPAAFANVVGLKPSRGTMSMRGVVPACRSLDCLSVFALTVDDACAVADVAKGWDPLDPFSRTDATNIDFSARTTPGQPLRLGVPAAHRLEFQGDSQARAVFDRAVRRFAEMGCELATIDFDPFREAGKLLFEGPWVAERLHACRSLLSEHPEALLPVLREILSEALRYDALATFEAHYRLGELRQAAESTWRSIDALLLPTTPTIYRIIDVLEDPRVLNAHLGVYTAFVNLMDLAAIAVPAGFRADGLPAGITLVGRHGTDARLATLAATYHRALGGTLGATHHEPLSR
jgi:allophanate hydrolase